MVNSHLSLADNVVTARFVRREKRFSAFVKLENDSSQLEQQAFLHDPGRLKELLFPNVRLLLRPAPNSASRQSQWDIMAVEHSNAWVIINSGVPNVVIQALIENKSLSELKDFDLVRSEVPYHTSRFDFLLQHDSQQHLVEVKGVSLANGDKALFPDAPSSRATRQLEDLMRAKLDGYLCSIVFLVMREDCKRFLPNYKIDPIFAQQLVAASEHGVDILVYKINPLVTGNKLQFDFVGSLPFALLF